jgi:hypothetical protein
VPPRSEPRTRETSEEADREHGHDERIAKRLEARLGL